ncbi:MAG: diguanylate cyclase [Gemmatimonadota bacterium]
MSDQENPVGRFTVGDRYHVLLDVGRRLAATLSTDELYAAIYHETSRVIESSGFYVSLYDQARDLATIVFFAERGEVRQVSITYRGSDSEVVRSRTACLVTDGLDDYSLMHLGEDDTEVTRSAISAPMVHKGRLLGVISAQSYRADAYSREDLALLQGIADISAVAIDNAQHVAELERRRREAERIEEIGRSLTSSLDPTDVVGQVVEAVTDILSVDGASAWLADDPTGRVVRVASASGDIELPEGLTWDLDGPLAERLMGDQQGVTVEDLSGSDLIPDHLRRYLAAGSGIGSPLVVAGEVVGVLTAGSRNPRHFSEEDAAVLQRLASQAAVALENARLHTNLRALSLTDALTGLPNRRRLQIHLDKEVAAARRGRPLTLVMFDLDNFKHYNDTLGHVVGDDVLRAFADVLAIENRAMNLVARYGGDEFISALSDSDGPGAGLYVQRIRERVADSPVMGPLGVTATVGVAIFDPETMSTPEDVIRAADDDMYRGKIKRRAGQQTASP